MLQGMLKIKEKIFHFINLSLCSRHYIVLNKIAGAWMLQGMLKIKEKYFSFYKTEAFAQGTILCRVKLQSLGCCKG
jgi:hypothetical protein